MASGRLFDEVQFQQNLVERVTVGVGEHSLGKRQLVGQATGMNVDEILAAMGTPDAASAIDALSTLDGSACSRIVLSGAPGMTRAAYEDRLWLMCTAANRWPDDYASTVESHPHLLTDHAVVAGLGCIPTSDALLVRAAKGSGWARSTALRALADRRSPHVPDLLLEMLADRSWEPRFQAIVSAIEWGDDRLIPRLTTIADDPATAPGAREYARDAIEAISQRLGLPCTTARLVSIHTPNPEAFVAKVHVTLSQLVSRGDPILELNSGPVPSPCDGIVVSIPVTVGSPAPPTLARIRTRDLLFPGPMPD